MSELHRKVNRSNPESHNEILFYQKYGYKIKEAWNYLTNYWTFRAPIPTSKGPTPLNDQVSNIKYDHSNNVMAMHEVADIYTELAKEMSKEMDDLSTVYLFVISDSDKVCVF